MSKQSIKTALKRPEIRTALSALVGCPFGSWPQTAQAEQRLADELPKQRAYTRNELINAALTTDHADRYQWR